MTKEPLVLIIFYREKYITVFINITNMENHNNDEYRPIVFYMDYINIEYNKYLNMKFKGLTPRDFTYLITIYYNPNLSQRELSNILIVSEVNVGQIIKRLEKNNLIKRDFDEKNKSRRIISLTNKGETFVLSILDASRKWENKFFEKYDIKDEIKFKEMISDYYFTSINE
ncbi:MAG: MarR family transcriptional regulator [Methanobrevibacter sp.]|nr:MarR family transcriptional regulator [Methanobrevibacter sp.]